MLFINAPARIAGARAIALTVGIISSLFGVSGAAVPGDLPVLTLEAAVAQTISGNPDLAVTPYLLRVSEAGIAQARLRPAPELSVQVEDFLGTGRAQGFSGSQTTLALSQVVELGGRRDRRTAATTAAFDLVGVAQQARQLDVLAETTRRYIELVAGQERLALNRRAVDLARRTTSEVRLRVEAAKAPDVELYRAQVAQRRARLATESAEHELQSARHRLAAMWGATDATFGKASADLYRLPEPETFEQLLGRVRTNPDFLRFASEARLRDAEIRLAQSRRSPDVRFGLGVRRLQDTGDDAFVASLSFPLFSSSRNASVVAEAQSRRELIDVEEEAAFIRIQAQLFELHQELRHALHESSALRDDILPSLEAVREKAEYAYRRGRYSYLEWTAAQAELLDAQRARIEAAADAHRYLAEIERLTDEPVASLEN